MNGTGTDRHDSEMGLTVDDLLGRQSVRATFRLPQDVIDLLSVLAGQLGIKKKSLFDQLIDDVSVLEQIAREAEHYSSESSNRRPKTFVISRSSLMALNQISAHQNVPRDLLVEISIRRLLPVIQSEQKKHYKRKELQKEMAEQLKTANALLQKTAHQLGKDDQLYRMLQEQVATGKKHLAAVNKLIQKGAVMEDW